MNFDINNLAHYNQEMAKSAYDKLAFVNRIYENINIIVDFGCADATVTRYITLFYPESTIIGYDLPEVIERNHLENNANLKYTSDLNEIKGYIQACKNQNLKSLLIMNSVHHELFNYMTYDTVGNEIGYADLLTKLYSIGFDYIFIRDLNIQIPTLGKGAEEIPQAFVNLDKRLLESEEYSKRYTEFLEYYNNGEHLNPLSLEGKKQFVHFLLKCRYKDNWDRELPENYLSDSSSFNKAGLFLSDKERFPYHMTDIKYYVLPFVEFINKREFGISLRSLGITTHSQCLFKHNILNSNNKNKNTNTVK